MKIYKLTTDDIDKTALIAAADAIKRGELVIFPTETVYGLAADAMNEEAVKKVFEAKGRDDGKPLPVQIADASLLETVCNRVTDNVRKLADVYWPGALTIVVKKSHLISEKVSAGSDTVGIRIPDHPAALAFLKEVGRPIVATSANLSDNKSPVNADEAISQLGKFVDIVLDSGECGIGVASTVIDMTNDSPRILREGVVSLENILKTLEMY